MSPFSERPGAAAAPPGSSGDPIRTAEWLSIPSEYAADLEGSLQEPIRVAEQDPQTAECSAPTASAVGPRGSQLAASAPEDMSSSLPLMRPLPYIMPTTTEVRSDSGVPVKGDDAMS
jgi:hypothetical protein